MSFVLLLSASISVVDVCLLVVNFSFGACKFGFPSGYGDPAGGFGSAFTGGDLFSRSIIIGGAALIRVGGTAFIGGCALCGISNGACCFGNGGAGALTCAFESDLTSLCLCHGALSFQSDVNPGSDLGLSKSLIVHGLVCVSGGARL